MSSLSGRHDLDVCMTKKNHRHAASLRLTPMRLLLFLSLCAALSLGSLPHASAQNGAALPAFEEIPASVSGITWTHDNAMSEQRYLPETLGPGGAFLDYDNDGWMDIYFVNYGPCD